jgi:ubiquinone/menaquinone biosynthesis C-methylase UbiE
MRAFPQLLLFFALMYIKDKDDQIKVFQEVARVLKPGGKFHIWEVDLAEKPETDKEFYIVHLRYKTGLEYKETGYGMRWSKYPRGMKDYLEMAEVVGLVEDTTRLVGNTFYLSLRKL